MGDWRDIVGWFTEDDVEAYRALVSGVPNYSSIIELGCYCGRSLASISDMIKMKELEVTVIDLFGEFKHQDYVTNIRDRFNRTLDEFNLRYSVDVIHGKSTCLVPKRRPALVFIDTSHDEHTTVEELKHWIPLVRAGGWIGGHDWGTVKDFVLPLLPEAKNIKGGVWGARK